MRTRYNVDISTSSIARALDTQLIRLKKVYDLPVERNEQRVKDGRREYAEWFMAHGVQHTCIFVDETNFNIWTRRTRGRAAAGERPMRRVRGRSPNLNLILAVSEHVGIVYYELTRRTVNAEKFSHFLDNLEVVVAQELAFVIMDNAPIHNGATFHGNQQQVKLYFWVGGRGRQSCHVHRVACSMVAEAIEA